MQVELKDLLEIRNGADYRNIDEGDVPVYGSGGQITSINKWLYDGESILLPRKGTLDNILFVYGKFWTIDTMYWSIVNKNKVVPYYLYNYLRILRFNNLHTGSTLPSMTTKAYYSIKLDLPSLDIQKKVAYVLKILDSKIELNNKINAELEKIAKTLYDYWFVQFDFPNETNRPYKSSGGAMVYNEELKREIPKGWEVSSLDRKKIYSSDYTANGSFAGLAEHVKYNEGIHYAILVRIIDLKNDFEDFNDLIYINRGAYDYLSKTHLKGGEVIVCNVGDVGATYRCPKLKVPMTLGPNGIVINSPIYNDYLYNYFKHGQGQLLMRSISSGSVQQKFNKTNFRNLPILMPDRNIFELFNKKYKVIRDKMENIWSENKKMRELRDFLLPMLMNGQVKVI